VVCMGVASEQPGHADELLLSDTEERSRSADQVHAFTAKSKPGPMDGAEAQPGLKRSRARRSWSRACQPVSTGLWLTWLGPYLLTPRRSTASCHGCARGFSGWTADQY